MTVDSTYTPDNYAGTGSQDTFAYTFRILEKADIKVQIKDTNSTFTTKTLTTHYTVTGRGNQSGGNVVFTAGNFPLSTDTVVLTRNVPVVQGTDYTENSTFPAESHEEALDELTMICQQIGDETSRALRVDAATSGFSAEFSPTASEYLRVASDGLSLETTTLVSGGGIAELLEDPSPQIAANLDTNTFNITFDDAKGILDDSSNEQLIFQKTASAVNNIEITNSATGNAPTVSAAGDDTNVDLSLASKGTSGQVEIASTSAITTFTGTSAQAAEWRLNEITSSGTNYTGFRAANSISNNRIYTLPADDGTSTQVLTTDGSQTLSWADNTPPGMVLLATADASASSTIDFDNYFTSTYEMYLLTINGMETTADATTLVHMRFGTGATPTYQSGASDYWWTANYGSSTPTIAFDAADSEIEIFANHTLGNTSGEISCAKLWIYDPANAGIHTTSIHDYNFAYSAGYMVSGTGGGRYLADTAVTSVRIFTTTNTIATGKFHLYGFKSS